MTERTHRDRPTKRSLAAGDRIGSYVLTGREIGSGGFGQVFEAVGQTLELRVAVKVQDAVGDSEARGRALREARALARIRHRNVVRIFDAGELDDGRQYLAMELLAGETLHELLRREHRLPPERALALLGALAGALDAIHARGIVHRDLKPSNVFLCRDDDGEVYPKLIDFGIARDTETPPEGELTRSGVFVGTPGYMSPEQAAMRRVDARSDVYSFGLLAYQMLCGRPPFIGEAIDVAHQHLHAVVPPISNLCPELPQPVDDVFAQVLAKQPDERPASAAEAVAWLARALDPAPPRRVGRGRRRLVGAALAAVLGVAAIAAVMSLAREGNQDDQSFAEEGGSVPEESPAPTAADAIPTRTAVPDAGPRPEAPSSERPGSGTRRRRPPGINDLEGLPPR